MNHQKKSNLIKGTAFFLSILVSMGIFCLSYRYDNKYMLRSPQPIGGILMLSREDLSSDFPVYLINGWEYYYGKLLVPEEVQMPDTVLDQYISLGQYGGFEAGNRLRPPHGSASYRLSILLPEIPDIYMLELPEIYSAYRLYINGHAVYTMGNPDQHTYQPRIHMDSVTFTAGGQVELLFAVSDWSHFYSGMVYPPAFGKAEVVSSLLTQRFAWYMILMSTAILLGIYQLLLSITLKSSRSLLFAFLCVAFAAGVSSPVVHSLFATTVQPYYGIEVFSRYAFFALAAILVFHLSEINGKPLWITSVCVCLFPFAVWLIFLTAPQLSYRQMAIFSYSAAFYKYACAAFMAWAVVRTVKHRKWGSFLLLTGIMILAVSLAVDRIFTRFEPIRFGWFSETAGFCFLLVLAVRLWMETSETYRRQIILEEEKRRLSEVIDMQRSYYKSIVDQIKTVQNMRHDLRHHLHAIRNLLPGQARNYADTAEAAAYIDRLCASPALTTPIRFCDAPAVDAVVKYYYGTAEKMNISCSIELAFPTPLLIEEDDLCVILGNLLENAVEACSRIPSGNHFIRLSSNYRHNNLLIEMHNSTLPGETAEHQHGKGLPSSKTTGRIGTGLVSVKTVVAKYGGDLWVENISGENGIDEFMTVVLLMNRKEIS